ncbi:MAG: DNA translocase FtsK [Lachnospiraceae bacterium]|nr:DNA translocase FtsK [Lachnospiraceae bacterium]
MASASGRKTTKGRTSTKGKTNTRGKKKTSGKGKITRRKEVDIAVKNEVMLIAIFAMEIFVFLCVIGIIQGTAAIAIANIMFGVFGLLAYLIPIIIFLAFAFGISNRGNTVAVIKLISAGVLVFLLGIIAYMLINQESFIISDSLIVDLYKSSSGEKAGGGVLFGLIAHGLYQLIGFGGTLFFVIVLGIISIVFITEKSLLSGLRKGGSYLIETAKEDAARRREYWESMEEDEEYEYDEELENKRTRLTRERKQQNHEVKEEKVRRSDMKVRGVASISSTALPKEKNTLGTKSDMHEIILSENIDGLENESIRISSYSSEGTTNKAAQEIMSETPQPLERSFLEELTMNDFTNKEHSQESFDLTGMPEPITEMTPRQRPVAKKAESLDKAEIVKEEATISQQIQENKELQKPYVFPPISLLKKGEGNKGDSPMQLKETAYRLQQTLQNFGVRVTVTDISQGPSVTRYELQPEQGVKVSKIVGLTDDIKLNLAATDIRIEAPIPGKAAVGIEVPNKENSSVALRDLLESNEFKKFPSNLTFAVGKDIGGQVVVTDIAKMPHMLIAGATGSGKSVCINTIIMSILYKANPDDVKLIMIDPKVVELSVYNGIPHLMIPVVTDPKKASAALHWGVAEMTERYKKFADLNVRDLKGYNKAVEAGKLSPEGEPLQKMPQIVIIVDELADLMMVAAGEVEESICRLAQLARAAGIHLIIATQRPSVDVITGLIKANMPSRIAFSVSSGVDSRTILDMNGAEKLLGKGDMLFYPQGYAKPARIQGAFVSDSEVFDVVEFLKNQRLGNTYDNGIEEKIKTMQTSGGAGSPLGGGSSDVDEYFADAGKFVIEKDKASIGMLQRVFKIGFNRAARIVDQLEEAGVVGAEEGTKPRKVLMSMEQFENYLEETV